MPTHIDAWTDFTCPSCFLVTLALEKLQKTQTVQIQWRSFRSRPPGSPPVPPLIGHSVAEQRQRLAERIQIEYGLVLNPGPIGISTHTPHLAVKYAEARGDRGQLHAALIRAYWLEARSIADPQVVHQLVADVGLDAAELAATLNDPVYTRQLTADARRGARVGVRGVPALLFANKYLVSGAQPSDVWMMVIRRIQTAERNGHPSRYAKYSLRDLWTKPDPLPRRLGSNGKKYPATRRLRGITFSLNKRNPG